VSGAPGRLAEPEALVKTQRGIAVPDAQAQGHACGFGLGDQRLQHGRCNPLALHFGNDSYIDDAKFVGVAIQQKPARGLPARFDNKVLRVREARSVIAGLRLILEAQQALALGLRQRSEFGFPGNTEQSEQEGFVFGAYRAEMDYRNQCFSRNDPISMRSMVSLLLRTSESKARPAVYDDAINSHHRRTCLRRWTLVLALIMAASMSADCKSAKLVASLKNPGYTGGRLHKILIIGMSENVGIRADFEDAMASALAKDGIEAIPGHTILLRPESSEMDLSYLKAQIAEHKIDGIVTSRLVGVKKDITYVPGQIYAVPHPYYNSFYGYYGTVYRQVYTPDYLHEDQTVRIETNVYATDTPEGELVWTAISDTFNPASAHKVIDGLVKLVAQELERDGIF